MVIVCRVPFLTQSLCFYFAFAMYFTSLFMKSKKKHFLATIHICTLFSIILSPTFVISHWAIGEIQCKGLNVMMCLCGAWAGLLHTSGRCDRRIWWNDKMVNSSVRHKSSHWKLVLYHCVNMNNTSHSVTWDWTQGSAVRSQCLTQCSRTGIRKK